MTEALIQGTAAARFRWLTGTCNFFLNTALVGVETLLVNEPVYPIELAVRWEKPKKLNAYDGTKEFVLKGTATLLVDGIDQYMRTLAPTPSLVNPTLSQLLTGGITTRAVSGLTCSICSSLAVAWLSAQILPETGTLPRDSGGVKPDTIAITLTMEAIRRSALADEVPHVPAACRTSSREGEFSL